MSWSCGHYRHEPKRGRETLRSSGVRTLFAISFVSGALSFGLEVLWTHLIAAVLGNSVYAFAGMLFFVLLGVWLGGLLATTLFRESKPISPFVSSLLLILGSALLAWQKGQRDRVSSRLVDRGIDIRSFYAGEALRWAQAGELLLPPAIALGMVYPTLFRMSAFPLQRRSEMASRLSGANSIGCVLGALLCGFLLIPRLGSEHTLTLLGVTTLLLGVLLSMTYGTRKDKVVTAVGALAAGLLWLFVGRWDRLALTSGGHVYFRRIHVPPDAQLLFFHEDTLGGMTTVVGIGSRESPTGAPEPRLKIMLTNGKFQASDSAETAAQTAFATIPILHTRDREDALGLRIFPESLETYRQLTPRQASTEDPLDLHLLKMLSSRLLAPEDV